MKDQRKLFNSLSTINQNWTTINELNIEKFIELKSRKLIIYSYCLPNNLLKEGLLKQGFKFILTNEVKKANLIINFIIDMHHHPI